MSNEDFDDENEEDDFNDRVTDCSNNKSDGGELEAGEDHAEGDDENGNA
jgi:hypothetical protein